MSGKETSMENYIVRIYRFEKDNPRHLVGIVESVEGERRGKMAFTNLDDLWEILNSQMSDAAIPEQGEVWQVRTGGGERQETEGSRQKTANGNR
jgi:hypothetical protein